MSGLEKEIAEQEKKYLTLLSTKFKNIGETATEIINLQAIMNLPKGTEHFLTDIHGEYEAFNHVLKNGSGAVRQKIDEVFGDNLNTFEKKELATVIYYPKEKIEFLAKELKNMDKWYKTIIYRLIEICSVVSSKYTSSKVRKAMPKDFSYIIQEIIYERKELRNKREYIANIIDTIISIGRAKEFVIAISNLIQRLIIDRLHIVGDIYDRGPSPHLIMDTLIDYHNVDIQWGNHDILWMGAGLGSKACIANVIRICARYGNNDILEDGYGINLLPLAAFAMEKYADDPCEYFKIKTNKNTPLKAQIHKAITVIQMKIEGNVIERNPEFEMEHRNLFRKTDFKKGTVIIDGVEYELRDKNFPTVDVDNPLKLTPEESEIMENLRLAFLRSEKLQRHIRFLFAKGSIYLRCNSNLLYHACIPLTEDGKLKEVNVRGQKVKGREYLDLAEKICREAYFNRANSAKDKLNCDYVWYMWCGKDSPMFGKDSMKTFERYFIEDKTTHTEKKNHYYTFYNEEATCDMILEEFDLNPKISHIVNGHVPVKVKKGESPIKANGKLYIIDGGFSRAYQPETGIAGYTLIYNSYGLKLVSHAPFESTEKAIKEGKDIISSSRIVNTSQNRIRVKDTDIGKELQNQINDLKKLLNAYRKGIIKSNDE
ncbi:MULTISPECIES: fructose-bisphosphatase class III [Fusobacterium]|jgi:fructose-1,6-bisphosphatase-3|uniref:Fructose-1,6-bisphosphatase class 3 n=1 Tax=Fusobacterium varium ATCC 27725 TaxID=469618 RepID=A0ABN5JF38_FUSVA|nr:MULTISPECIES: fructose-bisphosphatase class III [Fusobacterium]AVQ30031.1 fructose-bisphosphatase class III [Fusobacterium varium ATCC 27725]EES64948.1 firmicute fructose-1,6-bisphosphatase [Fusobacterium varium ATCC 27725]MCF0170765.1 fructose-bisphosphatase class III [Fusobacterium varium]MCF2673789.1 fructose-bisphosphatase class III [Fusobacterium varium]MCI6031769.1 fructose-bisphosphatase class III [Fusobacterium varium]